MSYRLEINGVSIITESVDDAVILVRRLGAPPVEKMKRLCAPQSKPRAKKTKRLTPADLVLPAKPLVCRKPMGCGKAFESENRMAWYCPPCTAKRDEGRAA